MIMVAEAVLALNVTNSTTLTATATFTETVSHYLQHHSQLSLAIAFTILSLLAAHYVVRRSQSFAVHVAALYVYPVKGCAPIQLSEAHYDRLGFDYDRRFMIVKSQPNIRERFRPRSTINGASIATIIESEVNNLSSLPVFQSQRQIPHMSLIQPSIDQQSNELVLSYKGSECRVPLMPPADSPVLPVAVWDTVVLTSVYDSLTIKQWISASMGEDCLVVTVMDGDNSLHYRPLATQYDTSNRDDRINASFSDGWPFLVASQSSLARLNKLVPSRDVEMIAFRPNIVLDGPLALLPPWVEDQWREIEINGKQSFTFAKPCDRCLVPTIIPSQGIRDPNGEPVLTLRKYRAMTSTPENPDSKIYFGQNAVQNQREGVLRVGDLVTVTKLKPKGQFVVKVDGSQ